MSENFSSKRIVKNSMLLYVRMLFTMWLNLYATRLALENLGVEEWGVYGVVGSIVAMLSMFSDGISKAVQRYLAFEQGRGGDGASKVFSSSMNIVFVISSIVFILLETIGTWVLCNHVDIPDASMDAAFWVFQLSIFIFVSTLVSVPYNALVIIHERMDAFAVISILQVVLNFGAAYFISLFDERLLWYGVLMAVASFIVLLAYQVYCNIKFPESRYRFSVNRDMMEQIGRFAGISTTSGALLTMSSQGIVLVINWVFGVALNAVYATALQLKNAVLSFAFNIFKAISPQIMKTYASGEIDIHKRLVYSGAKVEAFMIFFIMIPFMFRAEYIMQLWLKNVPTYAVEFAQSTIFLSLTYAIFEPIRTAVLATNKIGKFMIYPELFYLMVLPLGYIVGRLSESPLYFIITIVAVDILTCVLRTLYAVKVSPITVGGILMQSICPSVLVAFVSSAVCYMLAEATHETFWGLCMLLLLNSIALCCIILVCGLNKYERDFCIGWIRKILKK